MKEGNQSVIYLYPGEHRFSEKPEVVTTILGSCLSATMFVRRLRIGAIFHALLPENNSTAEICTEGSYKYVDEAINNLLKIFDNLKVSRDEIEVKIFGGANMLVSSNDAMKVVAVGSENIRSALKTLKKANLNVKASDTGGNRGRKLFFFTGTGEIYLKHLRKVECSLPVNLNELT